MGVSEFVGECSFASVTEGEWSMSNLVRGVEYVSENNRVLSGL